MDFYYSCVLNVDKADGGVGDDASLDFHLKKVSVGDVSIVDKKGPIKGTSFARSIALAELLAASKPAPNTFDRAVRNMVRRLKIDGDGTREFEKDAVVIAEISQMTTFGVRAWRASDVGKEQEGSPTRLIFESSFSVPLEETFKRPIQVDVLCPVTKGHEYSVLLPVAHFDHTRVRNLVWMSKMLNDAGKASIIKSLATFYPFRVSIERVEPFYFVFASSGGFSLEFQYPPQAVIDLPFITSRKYHQLVQDTVDACDALLRRSKVEKRVLCVFGMKKEDNVYTVSGRIVTDDIPDAVRSNLIAIFDRLDTWVTMQFPLPALENHAVTLSPANKEVCTMDNQSVDECTMIRDKLVECAELLEGAGMEASRKLSGKLKKVQKHLSDRERSKLFRKDGCVDAGFLRELIGKYSSFL